jgi:hypothetical protein
VDPYVVQATGRRVGEPSRVLVEGTPDQHQLRKRLKGKCSVSVRHVNTAFPCSSPQVLSARCGPCRVCSVTTNTGLEKVLWLVQKRSVTSIWSQTVAYLVSRRSDRSQLKFRIETHYLGFGCLRSAVLVTALELQHLTSVSDATPQSELVQGILGHVHQRVRNHLLTKAPVAEHHWKLLTCR